MWLDTLIRLETNQLKEKQKNLQDYQQQVDRLVLSIDKLKIALRREQKIIEQHPELTMFYEQFETNNIEQQVRLQKVMQVTEEKISNIKEEIITVFETIKKYEFLKGVKDQEALAAIAHREGLELDEIALRNHTKKD